MIWDRQQTKTALWNSSMFGWQRQLGKQLCYREGYFHGLELDLQEL
jgi:hypothetical protein